MTEKMKMDDLQAQVKKLTSEKEKIMAWVKAKQDEVNAFNAKAEQIRDDLVKQENDLSKKKKDLTHLEDAERKENAILQKERKELVELRAKNNVEISEIVAQRASIEVRMVELKKLEESVNYKLSKWNLIKESFSKI
jgi:chromosome segregation ATPase